MTIVDPRTSSLLDVHELDMTRPPETAYAEPENRRAQMGLIWVGVKKLAVPEPGFGVG